jgi:predicted esterase
MKAGTGLLIAAMFVLLLFTAGPSSAQQITTVNFTLDGQMLRSSDIPAEMQDQVQKTCQVGFCMNQSGKASNILVTFAPEGRNLAGMPMFLYFTNQLSLLQISPQPQISHTNSDYLTEYFYTLQAVEYAKQKGLAGRNAKTIVTGHSGGGKVAMLIGALGGTRHFNGILAMGCNQDTASEGYRMLSNSTALSIPLVLLNATDDNLVVGKTENVMESLAATGFNNIYLQSHTGGHRIPFKEGLECLRFLLKQ